MPRQNKQSQSGIDPVPVEALTHDDKRVNIPTADAADFVGEQAAAVQQVRYARDPSLDPQLVWKGKDEQDSSDLVADAPPVYIQEKVDPRVLIENLRATAATGEPEPELTLFDSFDGLDEWESVDFYSHPANWSNRMILGDSLNVMASQGRDRRSRVGVALLDPVAPLPAPGHWQDRREGDQPLR